MTSGNSVYYTISFFTFLPADKRENFYLFATFIARVLTKLFNARLHWGKYYPLVYDEIKQLYPQLKQFRDICQSVDSESVFHNDYTKRILGFS